MISLPSETQNEVDELNDRISVVSAHLRSRLGSLKDAVSSTKEAIAEARDRNNRKNFGVAAAIALGGLLQQAGVNLDKVITDNFGPVCMV